ncbi:MAG TPA: TIGR00730 family Rossman fold protein [Planctomycetaceae bacterium]|nr:TIGR00730 family Rossman fold protein [Planctomycetaceae bacterium]HIQ22775.1 TIGR00730 family Rossman fold protein [Planctomycetota bacterium]
MGDDRRVEENYQRILRSRSYRVAYRDVEFLSDPRLRPTRMELELLKPELVLQENRVVSTVVVFGSTRIADPATAQRNLELARARLADTPDDPRRRREVARAERILAKSRYYELARQFAAMVSQHGQRQQTLEYVIITGGGPGIMEAANRGAFESGAKSIGLNIRLPKEQKPNPYITPELCFQFHYFAMRKFHFLLRAKALVVFPGGFGTLDELFDAMTLRQTQRMQDIPIIIFGREYWERVVDFQFLADEGTIDDSDLDLFRFADTPQEAWEMILRFHGEL